MIKKERALAVDSLSAQLRHRMSPRAHMLAAVTLTGACGFLASFLSLRAGLHSMAIRYPIAVGIAYLAFIGLIALWLRRHRLRAQMRREMSGTHVDLDVANVPLDQLWSRGTAPEAAITDFGGGGGFAGGGAGASWGGGPTTFSAAANANLPSGASIEGDLDVEPDFGDGVVVFFIPAVFVGIVVLSGVIYVVWVAPWLFAELLIDAGLTAALYKKLLREDRRSWLATAVRRTIVPAGFVAILLAVAGAIMQQAYPTATSIGMVIKQRREGADQ